MIAVDTSALVAILMNEPESARFAQALQDDEEPLLSTASYVEMCLVMKHKKGKAAQKIVESLIEKAVITLTPVTVEQANIAARAARHFPILNYGDTFSYALAVDKDIPLLFKGDDFGQTDVTCVLK